MGFLPSQPQPEQQISKSQLSCGQLDTGAFPPISAPCSALATSGESPTKLFFSQRTLPAGAAGSEELVQLGPALSPAVPRKRVLPGNANCSQIQKEPSSHLLPRREGPWEDPTDPKAKEGRFHRPKTRTTEPPLGNACSCCAEKRPRCGCRIVQLVTAFCSLPCPAHTSWSPDASPCPAVACASVG